MINFHSLPVKINTAILTTALTVSAVFIAILYPMELTRRQDQILRINLLLDTVFEQKKNDLANEVFAGQIRALVSTLNDMQTVDGIIGVNIYEDSGSILLASNDAFSRLSSPFTSLNRTEYPEFKTITFNDLYIGQYTNKIQVIGKKIGYIIIIYDLSKVALESKKAMGIIFILPLCSICLMTILLNILLFRSIIRPVTVLRNAMRRVGSGKLGETISLSGQDEIADMGNAFNEMSVELLNGNANLIEAKEKYLSIFQNTVEGLFQYSFEKKQFLTANPAMASLLGYESPEALIDSKIDLELQFPPDDTNQMAIDKTLEKQGHIIGFETEMLTKDRRLVWVSISVRRVKDPQGKLLYDEGSVVDITEHRQRMKAEHEREAAESANRAKTDFLAKMSHEIRTPLNAILGFTDILGSSLKKKSDLENLEIIKGSGKNLLNIINDILDYSKIETGHMEIRPEPMDLRILINELLNLFSISIDPKKVVLTSNISDEINALLMIDRVRLRQILFNLIGNAAKFTQSGSIEINVLIQNSHRSGFADVRIDVTDTGIGIAPDALKIIFESFQQSDPDHSLAHEGTGLGLAISKNLVEMMGGKIKVISDPGKGSTFTILFPHIQAAGSTEVEPDRSLADCEEKEEHLFSPSTILIVDDLEVNRRIMNINLNELPLKIVEAKDGRSAVSLALEHQPDLILLDIMMPDMDGYQTIEMMRSQLEPIPPVIATTAAGMKEDIEKIQSVGFDDYLIRPFSKAQLIEKLSVYLTAQSVPQKKDDLREKPVFWECSEQLKNDLLQNYIPEWISICEKQRLPDIRSFGEKIFKLGKTGKVDPLKKYGKELIKYTDSIDIEKIETHLADFPELMNMLKATP